MEQIIKIKKELHYKYEIKNKKGVVIVDGTKMKGEPKIYIETTENEMFDLTATEAFHLANAMLDAVYGLRLTNKPYYRDCIMPRIPGKSGRI